MTLSAFALAFGTSRSPIHDYLGTSLIISVGIFVRLQDVKGGKYERR